MIRILLVLCAMYELFKVLLAEQYTKLSLKLRQMEVDKTKGNKTKFDGEDALAILGILFVNLIYIFVLFWVLIFGANIYAQSIALFLILSSYFVSAILKRVSKSSIKLYTIIIIFDGFLGVLANLAMAYFYQRPL